MRFAFTEDQLALRDAVRDLLGKECPPEVVRSAWPEPDDYDGRGAGARADADRVNRLWSALADMGVLGVGVPEASGGLGLDEIDWVLLAEETGYAAVPHPFVDTACVATPLLAAAGDPTGDLADVLAGRTLVSAALAGAMAAPWLGAAEPDHPVLMLSGEERLFLSRFRGHAGGGTGVASIDGGRRMAPVPAARFGGGTVEDFSADGGAPGMISDDPVLLTDDPVLIALALDRGMLGTAGQLVGLGRRMLDMTVAYVTERKQFGVPVGSFQAVKHHLANAALGLEFAAPAVCRAAWSCATDAPTRSRDVSMAKVMAGDAATFAGRAALQCHGAIGYTVEYDLHLFLKRAWALSRAWGDAAWHRDRVGRAIGV